jgi:uncharacterized membrane protein YgaE (UPF0421/DUF939 family)
MNKTTKTLLGFMTGVASGILLGIILNTANEKAKENDRKVEGDLKRMKSEFEQELDKKIAQTREELNAFTKTLQ